MRLPKFMRRTYLHRAVCWYCDGVFSLRVRKSDGVDEDGDALWENARTGRPLGFMDAHYCPRCRP